MSEHTHIFSGGGIDRLSEKRGDATWLANLRARSDARILLFRPDLHALVQKVDDRHVGPVLISPGEVSPWGTPHSEEPILLGLVGGGAPLYAQIVEPAREDIDAIDLRTLALQGLMAPVELGRVGHAKQLLEWHLTHGFCAKCGTRSRISDGGTKRICPSCEREHFPRVDPVVIMLPIRGDNCLMGRQSRFLPGMYSALAGFLEPGESIEEAVRRETLEESGITVGRVHYHSSQPWPFPSSLMIGCLAEAETETIDFDRDELDDCRWFSRDDVRRMLARQHPDNLFVPYPFAIAHHLVKAFIAG